VSLGRLLVSAAGLPVGVAAVMVTGGKSMTRDREFKRQVRTRMRLTGERYTVAQAEVERAPGAERRPPQDPERLDMTEAPQPTVSPFNWFSDRSRRAVVHSQNLAHLDGSESIRPVHLLQAISMVAGLGDQLLRTHAPTLPWPPPEAPGEDPAPAPGLEKHIPFSPEAKRSFELAYTSSIADDPDAQNVSTQHLLAGVLDLGDGEVLTMVRQAGADLPQLRAALPGAPTTI